MSHPVSSEMNERTSTLAVLASYHYKQGEFGPDFSHCSTLLSHYVSQALNIQTVAEIDIFAANNDCNKRESQDK